MTPGATYWEVFAFRSILLVAALQAVWFVWYANREFGTDWNDVELLIAIPYVGYDSADDVPSVQAAQRLVAESNAGGDDA
jgi:hypothetical protein